MNVVVHSKMDSVEEELIEIIFLDLKKDEGFRDKLYDDKTSKAPKKTWKGKLTILYGYNIEDRGLPEWVGELLLRSDIDYIIQRLQLQWSWWEKLSFNRKRALINMAYNLGLKGLFGFRQTIKFLSIGEYLAASKSALNSKWAREDVSESRSNFVAQLLLNG